MQISHCCVLRHYEQAIQALSAGEYDGLAGCEREALLRRLRSQQQHVRRLTLAEGSASSAIDGLQKGIDHGLKNDRTE